MYYIEIENMFLDGEEKVVWNNTYANMDDLQEDLSILLKPSLFGQPKYRFHIRPQ